MSHQQITPTPKLSLRPTLVMSFVVQIAVAVGLTGWLSFRKGQQSVNKLVNQTSNEVTDRVEKHITTFGDTPYQFLQINAAAIIRTSHFNLTDYLAIGRFFWAQTHISEAVPYVDFGNSRGDFVGIWRETDSLTTLRIRDQSPHPRREIYQLDRQGNPTALIKNDTFEPRSRLWYQAAVDAGQSTWSPVYVFANPPRLGITQSIPIYDVSDALLGVLAVDLTLSDISQFLRRLDVSDSGQVFIIEDSEDARDTVQESFPPELAAVRMHYIQQALATGKLQVYEHQLMLNGQRQNKEVRIMVLGEDEVLNKARNISARKQAEQALEQANQALEQKVAERTATLATSQRTLKKSNRILVKRLQKKICCEAKKTSANLSADSQEMPAQ